jgi:DNA-binding NarL/FixJ family response regulator
MSPRFIRPLPNLPDRSAQVLVCEDSDELRALIVSRLARQPGLDVVGEVADGEAVLEAVVRLRPDALLLDLLIDDTDPDEMLQTLAAIDARPLVIVFSGLAPDALAPESRPIIHLHLDKTTPLQTVAELVAEAIASHRAAS